jgi:hypothetical protein
MVGTPTSGSLVGHWVGAPTRLFWVSCQSWPVAETKSWGTGLRLEDPQEGTQTHTNMRSIQYTKVCKREMNNDPGSVVSRTVSQSIITDNTGYHHNTRHSMTIWKQNAAHLAVLGVRVATLLILPVLTVPATSLPHILSLVGSLSIHFSQLVRSPPVIPRVCMSIFSIRIPSPSISFLSTEMLSSSRCTRRYILLWRSTCSSYSFPCFVFVRT